MKLPALSSLTLLACLLPFQRLSGAEPAATTLRFAVTLAPGLDTGTARTGRLLVVLGQTGTAEPRLQVGQTGLDAAPILGRDVNGMTSGKEAILDDRSTIFPIERLADLLPRTYAVQALLHTNTDLNHPNAPGDLYSPVKLVKLDPVTGGTVALELSRSVPAETLPADTELVKSVKIRSRLLSEFHGRSIDLRGGGPAARLRTRARSALSAARAHRRIRKSVYRLRPQDESGIIVSRALDGRRHAADDRGGARRSRAAR